MKHSTIKIGIGLALGCCLGLAAMPSMAQSPISDRLIVRDPTGAIASQVIVTEADEATQDPNGPNFPFFFIPDINVDPARLGNYTSITDPDGTVGDVFGLIQGLTGCRSDSGLCLGFASDVDGVPFGFGAGPINLLENSGQIFDATTYLSATLQSDGWTATFQSDDETTVPEPGSLALLGIGAAALALRRKMRT